MTAKEARQLLVGTVIMFDGNSDNKGTVRRITRSGFWVNWENGDQEWIDYRGADRVSLWQPKKGAG